MKKSWTSQKTQKKHIRINEKKTNHQESGNSKLNQDMDDLQQQINRAEDVMRDVMRGLNPAQDNTNIPRSEQGKKKSKYAVPNSPMVIFTDGLGISACKGCPKGITKEEQKYPNNMVFRRRGSVSYFNRKLQKYVTSDCNIHIHLNKACLR